MVAQRSSILVAQKQICSTNGRSTVSSKDNALSLTISQLHFSKSKFFHNFNTNANSNSNSNKCTNQQISIDQNIFIHFSHI